MRLSTERFSDRVDNYVRYRPHYPHAVLDCLSHECGLSPRAVVADVGSGTGILSELFLRHGNRVLGVEPNRAMREAGADSLRSFEAFESVDGTAENTTLPAESADFVTAGQAFHWFDVERCRCEFQRILRPGGWVVLAWNERREGTLFGQEYLELVRRFAVDYDRVKQKLVNETVLSNFFAGGCETRTFPNAQTLDFQGLKGRFLSSSYTPQMDHPAYADMEATLRALFDGYAVDGKINFEYDTNVYFGQLPPA